ncbi:hypothetical protein QTP70_025486 [Hemibagrus guttatus]|uniref:Deoxycytidylate deaminase n=1 Tax=Hemibagrus guttatus TaxID=175788 RepID=A0AAE0RHH4_9TELE|nr:hypothetical protein QTP70_025486 [Hemibagrus guttatus]
MASNDKMHDPSSSTQTRRQYEDDVYFMSVALMFAKKSPDPSTKVGACIVNEGGKIVGVGFNKMPDGCEGKFPWKHDTEDEDPLNTKGMYVCHAELNAIVNKTSVDVKGCTIYVTLFPCNECAKLIVQSGIKNVVYLSNKHKERNGTKAAFRILDEASTPKNIIYRQFESKQDVRDLLDSIDPFAE